MYYQIFRACIVVIGAQMFLNTFDGFYGYNYNAEAEFEKNPCS